MPIPRLALRDCNPAALKWFRERAAKSGRVDEQVLADSDAALLASLQLEDGEHLKRATALLFGKEPERIVPGAFIKLGFFITDDNLRYQDEIHGDLFSQVEKTLETLRAKYLKAYISYEGLQRVETYLFPMPALREGLLNAVMHKDYGSGIPIQISVYAHQIVLWNAGQLPERWTLEKLMGKHPSHPYNPLLASAFFRAGYVESWGRGIEKIHRECANHDAPVPIFDTSMSGLMLTFKANPVHLVAAVGEKAARALLKSPGEVTGEVKTTGLESVKTSVKTSVKILQAILEDDEITIPDLAKLVEVTTRSVERNIRKLQEEKKLRRIGPDKGGRWEVLK